MATKQLFIVTLECDSCGKDGGDRRQSAEAVREHMATQGWQRVPKLKLNGKPSSRFNDICPDCLSAWEPSVWDKRDRAECGVCHRVVAVTKIGTLANHPPGYPVQFRCRGSYRAAGPVA